MLSGTDVRKLENDQLPFTVPIAIAVSKRTGIALSLLLSRKQLQMAQELAEMAGAGADDSSLSAA